MKYALVRNAIVEQILEDLTNEQIVEHSAYYENIVDVTNDAITPEVGWTFNGSVLVPPLGVVAKPSMKITRLAFLSRFTDAEVAAIETFAFQNNPYSAALRGALRKQSVSSYMDLERVDTIVGVSNLVALGLITQQRATAILTTPPTELEKYKGQL